MFNVRSTLALTLTLAVLVGCDDDPVEPADPVEELLAEIQSGTQGFQQIDAATAAGYAEASPCVASPAGGMGFHYLNQTLLDAAVVPSQPELLLYEPTATGGMRLVGVEYMVMAPEWDQGNAVPPELLGRVFDDHRAEDDRHGIPFPHYDLHVWAWEPNPAGPFEAFNPNVSCDSAG